MQGRYTTLELLYDNAPISADVAAEVESFTYTDSAADSADSVSITINARDGARWLGSWMPKKGARLHPVLRGKNWIAQGDSLAMDCGTLLLDSMSYSDAPGAMEIAGVARPSDTDFSERDRGDVWRNTSTKRIAQDIAARYGLGFGYDADEYPIEAIEQDGPDSDFLARLCDTYGLVLKTYSGRLWVYDREQYKAKAAVQTFRRTGAEGDPNVIVPGTFRWTTDMAGTYTRGYFSYTDPDKDMDITASVGSGNRTKDLNQRADSVADAAAQLVAALNNANHGKTKISFTVRGNFAIASAQTVQLEGFGLLDGKYFVDEVQHEMSRGSGYTCAISASQVTEPFYAWQVGGNIVYNQPETEVYSGGYTSNYATTSPAASAASTAMAKKGGTAGAALTLKNCPLYYTSVIKTMTRRISGTYWLYDGILVNGRYRITNAPSRCGKLPVGTNVTGWVNPSDIGL